MKLLFILLLGLGFSQTEVSQKVIDFSTESGAIINLSDIYPDYNLEWAIINIIGCPPPVYGMCYIEYLDDSESRSGLIRSYTEGNNEYSYSQAVNSDFWAVENKDIEINLGILGGGSGILKLLVTAEFPEEDTGYIEEGFEFCLTPGANLLSFPCDSPINVGESLPQGVENFITEIVGQGVAASYNPALGWIGNLAEFTPGSGYWFKSNESLCFEYDCVED